MSETINTAAQFPSFEKPTVQFNEKGWGPCELPDTFKDVPYQPFSKNDRLGKICDWTNTSNNDKKYQSEFNPHQKPTHKILIAESEVR